jgi:hypothetical protein
MRTGARIEVCSKAPYNPFMKASWRFAVLFAAAAAGLLHAQGTKTRDDASKYSAHGQINSVSMGAALWGHYVPVDGVSFKTDEYLVVEVALFAPPSMKLDIDASQFVLTVNGQRLLPLAPGLATLRYVIPDMREPRPHLDSDAGVGPVTISTGRDPVQPKFPGDSNPANIPLPPRTQSSDDPLQRKPVDPVQAISNAALPEGRHGTPISGYLFYAYTGKLKRVKHVELEYNSRMGAATLSLR